jgi:hypothetical protein
LSFTVATHPEMLSNPDGSGVVLRAVTYANATFVHVVADLTPDQLL